MKQNGCKYLKLSLRRKLAALKEDLQAFNVSFDNWFSELTLHQAGAIGKGTCNVLLDNGNMFKEGWSIMA